jgi:hypothetical protein
MLGLKQKDIIFLKKMIFLNICKAFVLFSITLRQN